MNRVRNPNFMRKVVLALWPRLARYTYRPERHYMRGPGPMTLSKIGEMLRERVDDITQEPLPQRWLDLVRDLEQQKKHPPDHGSDH
jgi:hypothetical protein